MRKKLLAIFKVVFPLAIIVWLIWAIDPSQWHQLRDRPKNWTMLGIAFSLALAAVCLSFVRWYLLVRSLEMRFSLADAFRLSFLGYLLNFVAAGNVGGDLFKAYFIAREQPQRRTEAVATVVVDRLVGLYSLLLVASVAVFMEGSRGGSPVYNALASATILATAGGGIVLLMILTPGFTRGIVTRRLISLPYVGESCQRLIASIRIYRDKRLLTAVTFALSMAVHVILGVAMFLIARSLFDACPSVSEHMTIVPLSMVAAALPITPSGLGSFELAMDKLYEMVPTGGTATASGLLIALVYRLVTIAIAAIGLVYYWLYRPAVVEAIQVVSAPAARCLP